MSYSHYDTMSTAAKDKLVDGNELRKLTDEYRQKHQQQYTTDNIVLTPKRRYEDNDSDIQEMESDTFQIVEERRRKKKTRQLLNLDNQNLDREEACRDLYKGHSVQKKEERRNTTGRGMVIVNSQSHRNATRKPPNHDQQRNIQYQDKNNITQQALRYSVTQQLPPLKIKCQPKVMNQMEGTNLIKMLFSYIQEDFRKLNKSYNRPIGFDTWFVDKEGSLICYTKEIELFVFLWDVTHYPKTLLNTEITPIPPIHLPPQHSMIFKFVPTMISFEEMLEAISDVCQSKFYLEEMKGSMSNKSRHIRLDVASKEEVRRLLNSGVFPLSGQLLEVDEFLAPPQLLICNRCNRPGHVKKNCDRPFDRCKRCGLNKSEGEHIQCVIKCHHCEGEHLATDYRCPIMVKFRGNLIDELKRRPDLLPKDIQLFIPVEFRKGGEYTINGLKTEQAPIPIPLSTSNSNAWPVLSRTAMTGEENVINIHNQLLQDFKSLRNDYERMKLDFDRRENELMNKHINYKSKLNTMLNLLVLQNNQQNDCITKVYTVVNEIVPVISNSLKVVHSLIEKLVGITNDINLQNEYNAFQHNIEQSLSTLNDRNDLIIEHLRATSILTEKTNALFSQGIDLMTLNEQ